MRITLAIVAICGIIEVRADRVKVIVHNVGSLPPSRSLEMTLHTRRPATLESPPLDDLNYGLAAVISHLCREVVVF